MADYIDENEDGVVDEDERLRQQAANYGITGVTKLPVSGAAYYEFAPQDTSGAGIFGPDGRDQYGLTAEDYARMNTQFGTGGMAGQLQGTFAPGSLDVSTSAGQGWLPGGESFMTAIDEGTLPPLGLLPSESFAQEIEADAIRRIEEAGKWYNPANLIPAGIGLIGGLMTGGLGSTVIAPALGATGVTAGAITGAAGGLGSSAIGQLQNAIAGGDFDLGALAAGAGLGAVGGGLTSYAQGLMGGSTPPLSIEMQPMTDLYGNTEVLSALGESFGGIEPTNFAIPDIFGRSPLMGDYAYDPTLRFEKALAMTPEEELRAFYNTGNRATLDALGYMTDTGYAAGLEPSSRLVPEQPVAVSDRNIGRELLEGMLGSIGGSVRPDFSGIGPTRYDLRSPQARTMGFNPEAVSPAPDLFSQQMQMVKSAQTPYTQDLLSLAMEDPDILQDPRVKEMLQSQIMERGQALKRFGLEDPMENLGEVVI